MYNTCVHVYIVYIIYFQISLNLRGGFDTIQHSAVYTVQCILYTVYCTLYSVQCILNNLLYIEYITRYTRFILYIFNIFFEMCILCV